MLSPALSWRTGCVAMAGSVRSATDAILAAAQAGKVGEVVRLSRRGQSLTQTQLSDRCNLSQSTVSRIERSNDVRDVRTLRLVARELDIPYVLVGLADPPMGRADRQPVCESSVRRREFLGAAAAVVTSAIVTSDDDQPLAAIRSITASQRLLDADTPSRDLAHAVNAHLRLASRKYATAPEPYPRRRIATGISEIAGFAGWLHWDMHDTGSARSFYGKAIRAATETGDDTLSAYMLGSLAALSVNEGDSAEGIAIIRRAASCLGPQCPAIAVAWLSSLEAVAHAGAQNERRTWEALGRADEAVQSMSSDDPVPWPWVFPFSHEKVARHRLTCAARLRRPLVALAAAADVADFLHTGHAKQRALLQLDLAGAHAQTGDLDEAVRVAIEALDIGRQLQSGRIIDRARQFRRDLTQPKRSRAIHDFDNRLRSTQF
jgi:transcriptional regulator with XRE-family HTH domain